MLENFKEWFREIEEQAVDRKKKIAMDCFNDATRWKEIIWPAPEKNFEIKKKFRDEGYELGYKSRPSYVTKASEWLYDFVWRKFDCENNLTQVVLAMEIELSDLNEPIHRHDFNKLLQADSTYKVFVFQAKSEGECKAAMATLKASALNYRFKYESGFLLCAWCTSFNTFLFDDFIAHPGRQTDSIVDPLSAPIATLFPGE